MKVSRRKFLALAGAASIAGTQGCGNAVDFINLTTPTLRDLSTCLAPVTFEPDLNSHVLARLTFGPRPGDYNLVREMGVDNFIEQQLAFEDIDDSMCNGMTRRLESLNAPLGELFEYREEFLRQELTRHAILRAAYSERQLYEVMVEFWTDHFNISIFKGDCPWLKVADDRDVIRKHALGNFSDLLRASALSPAMLWYLDGRVNRKHNNDEKPNENYARELLELHTLGVRGGYTQKDVMEVARCLTGWYVRSEQNFFKGRVEFRKHAHDNGEKSVLGQSIPADLGEGDLDRLLDIVTTHPSTAHYLALKLCRRFISEQPGTETVANVASSFSDTQGDIRKTLRTLFQSDEFRNARSTKFKRPMRFLVSSLRASHATTTADDGVLEYLMRMGHLPFQYPTPDGYPEESGPWSGTLLWRWHFVSALLEDRVAGTKTNWANLNNAFGNEESLMAHFLGRKPHADEIRIASESGFGAPILLASPAFQRC